MEQIFPVSSKRMQRLLVVPASSAMIYFPIVFLLYLISTFIFSVKIRLSKGINLKLYVSIMHSYPYIPYIPFDTLILSEIKKDTTNKEASSLNLHHLQSHTSNICKSIYLQKLYIKISPT